MWCAPISVALALACLGCGPDDIVTRNDASIVVACPEGSQRTVACGDSGLQMQRCSGGDWRHVGPCHATNRSDAQEMPDGSDARAACECSGSEVTQREEPCGACDLGTHSRTFKCDGCQFISTDEVGDCVEKAECTPGMVQKGECSECLEQTCTDLCQWSECQLEENAECDWNTGHTWRCCAPGKWEFCISSCVWSGVCDTVSGTNDCK